MGAAEVEAFLTYLATQRQVSSTTQNQALSTKLSGSELVIYKINRFYYLSQSISG
jgi:hypothetical protein